MRTGIPIWRFLVQVLEGSGPLLLYMERHRVWKVALEHLGGIDHTPEMVRFDPVEKVLETEDVLQLTCALYGPGRHDHAEPDDRNGGENGGQDYNAKRKVEGLEALSQKPQSQQQDDGRCDTAA